MRLLIEVEGDEALEVMEEFRVLTEKLEDLCDELIYLREQLNADQAW